VFHADAIAVKHGGDGLRRAAVFYGRSKEFCLEKLLFPQKIKLLDDFAVPFGSLD
jgi:hypothetical protein